MMCPNRLCDLTMAYLLTLTSLNDSSASRTPTRCYTALQNAVRYFGALTKYCSQLHIQLQVVQYQNFLFYRPMTGKKGVVITQL